MCGIAGVMSGPLAPPPEFDELRRMAAMLSHRGPDGYGLYRDDRVGLAHARLSLLDLAGGAQPLASADHALWLSFNGEIFNYLELRRELAGLGRRFSTNGDSEVIVACYEQYGARAWEMLNGQFAFALWDSGQGRLWLVRDRLGILPLHYAAAPGRLIFASEAKAIFAGGRVAPRPDASGLCQAFTTWASLAPRTAFEGIRQVPPATALCFDEALEPTRQVYWRLKPARRAVPGETPAADLLESGLKASVALRLHADVPVGAYLSGGLDSSVLTSLAVESSPNIETFAIRFEDPRFDETREQRLVAGQLGTRHHELLCGPQDICDALVETIWHCETPLLRTSPAPLFLLSGAVKAAGIKAVLTGEGADELLCGYSIFKEDMIRRFCARRPDSLARAALLKRIHPYIGDLSDHGAAWRAFFGQGLTDTDHPLYSHLIRWRNSSWTLRLLAPDVRSALPVEAMLAEIEETLPADWRDWEPLHRAQYLEIQAFMSSYLLSSQGDRVAMAHGVEARYPFLDPDLVDLCFSLENSDRLIGTRDKLALRRVARRRLPAEIWSRRKQPFRAPIASALLDRAAAIFHELLSPTSLTRSGCFDPTAVARLLDGMAARGDRAPERQEMGLVGVLTLQLLNEVFGRQFAQRRREAEARLARMRCDVLVDRTSAQSPPAGARPLHRAEAT